MSNSQLLLLSDSTDSRRKPPRLSRPASSGSSGLRYVVLSLDAYGADHQLAKSREEIVTLNAGIASLESDVMGAEEGETMRKMEIEGLIATVSAVVKCWCKVADSCRSRDWSRSCRRPRTSSRSPA